MSNRTNILYSLLFHIILIFNFNDGALKTGEDCNRGRGECIYFGNCDHYLSMGNINLALGSIKYCDRRQNIVCCPKRIVTEVKYYQNSDSVFQGKCQNYYREVYKTCKPQPLIIGGSKADPKEFPFMALIGFKQPFTLICGATLISKNFVLTAAHCYYSRNKIPDLVRLGELDYSVTTDDAEIQDFGIKQFLKHPFYNFTNDEKYNDIALIELDRFAVFNLYVAPACLPLSNGTNFDKLTVIGWGSTKFGAAGSPHLLKAYVDRFDDDSCAEVLSENDKVLRKSTQICAGSDRNDTCSGDSGGPLFANHPDFPCMYIVIGITSYGLSCGLPGVPAPYTRVNLFIDWIETTVWNASDNNFK